MSDELNTLLDPDNLTVEVSDYLALATHVFVSESISTHNISPLAHEDIRNSLSGYSTLSGATFSGNVIINGSLSVSALSISDHIGYTHPKKVVLMDIDGDSFEVYLRSGILTYD